MIGAAILARDADYPAVIRWGRWGIASSITGYLAALLSPRVLPAVLGPAFGGRGGAAAWWALGLIWVPGAAGLLLAFYTVARYPYFSLAEAGGPRAVNTGRGVSKVLGRVVSLLAVVFALGTVATAAVGDPEAVWMGLMTTELAFVGWLLSCYRPDRHPTVATWLALTFGFAIPLAPFYLPSIWLGSRRLRRALRARPGGGAG